MLSFDEIFFYEGYVSGIVLFDGLFKFEQRFMSKVLSTIFNAFLGEFISFITFYGLLKFFTSFVGKLLSKDILTLHIF